MNRKTISPDCTGMQKPAKSLKEQGQGGKAENMIDEIIAGIFFSKRYTGQFDDWDDEGDVDLGVEIPEIETPAVGANDNWTGTIVHDFDDIFNE